MAGKKPKSKPKAQKRKVELVAVPLEVVPPEAQAAPAPEPAAPPPLPPPPPQPQLAEGAAAPKRKRRPIAEPDPVMIPATPDDVINNVLCREIVNPQDGGEDAPPADPNIAVLDEITNGLAHGTSVNHVKDDIIRIASHQAEKTQVIKTVLQAIDLTRVNRFVQVRHVAEVELERAVKRGDLKSTEYLAFLRYSQDELDKIKKNLADQSNHMNSFDTQSVIEKVDHARQKVDAQAEERFVGTTPQGREIIRKQLYVVQKALKKAGKMKQAQAQPNGRVAK
jgi:hypothetical protein